MALPKIDLPVFHLQLKSEDKKIRFRPFLVKEEKLLIMALESGEHAQIIDTIKQVINNCLIDELDLDNLPMFEVENIFLNLRARSMGEIVEVTYVCQNVLEEKKCGAEMELQVDLLKVALDMGSVDPVIKLTDKIGIKMKFPTFEVARSISGEKDSDVAMKIIRECTEFIFDTEQTYKADEVSTEEFNDFINNMTQEQFGKIKQFFDNIPKLKYSGNVQCPRCKKGHDVFLEGILDFFE
jgi:hypothetical protein